MVSTGRRNVSRPRFYFPFGGLPFGMALQLSSKNAVSKQFYAYNLLNMCTKLPIVVSMNATHTEELTGTAGLHFFWTEPRSSVAGELTAASQRSCHRPKSKRPGS